MKNGFKMSLLAAAAAMILPLAAHATTKQATTAAPADPIHLTNYPDQAAVQLDPNAAPAAFTTKPQPLLQLNNSEDFFTVNPGGNSAGGGGGSGGGN